MPRPNMISGNYNYLGVGGHYKSGIAGLGNVSQGELDNAGLTISQWQHLLANLNDDAAYGPSGYETSGLMSATKFPLFPKPFGTRGVGAISDSQACAMTGMSPDECSSLANAYNVGNFQQTIQALGAKDIQYYNPATGASMLGQSPIEWLQDNWMLLVGGAFMAMVLLPHASRR